MVRRHELAAGRLAPVPLLALLAACQVAAARRVHPPGPFVEVHNPIEEKPIEELPIEQHLRHRVSGKAPGSLVQTNGSAVATDLPVNVVLGWVTASPERPFCLALLALVVVGCFLRAASYDGKLAEKAAMVEKKRDALAGAIQSLVVDMEVTLRDIMESNAALAERNFEGKRRDFRRFLKQVCKNAHLFEGEEVGAAFRRFVLQWLAVFRECSIMNKAAESKWMPVINARWLRAEELEALAGCAEVAERASKWLEDKEVQIVEATLKHFRTRPWERPEEGGPAQPPSPSYMMMVCSFIFGLIVTAVAFLHGGDSIAALMAFSATLLSPVVLIHTESQITRLSAELERLKQKQKEVKVRNEEVMEFFADLEKQATMWQHRTVPHLDLLKEVHDAFWVVPKEQAAQFWSKAVECLDLVNDVLGPLEIWHGDNALTESELIIVASQLADKQGGISPKQARRTKLNLFGRVKTGVQKAALGSSRTNLTAKELHAKVDDWVPLLSVTKCFACDHQFNQFSRRKNCHRCGQVFCKACTQKKMPVPKLGYVEPTRVCDGCALELQQELIDEKALMETGPARYLPKMLSGVTKLSFLHVRVMGASGLQSGPGAGAPNAYVRLRCSETAEWVRTPTIRSDSNPEWFDEEVFFAVRANDTTLMAQVVNDHAAHAPGTNAFLGSTDVKFRQLPPGEWTPVKKTLDGRKQGVLEIAVRFAENSWQLSGSSAE